MQKETSAGAREGVWKRVLEAVRGNRKLEALVYGALVLAIVLLYAGSLSSGKQEKRDRDAQTGGETAAVDTQAETEKKLCSVLSSIRGAGHVEVMITFDTGAEIVTAMSKSVNTNSSETSDEGKSSQTQQVNEISEPATVSIGGGNEPIVLMEKQPVVRGVIVVAEGAADVRVKLDLLRAVEAVLDISPSQIEVFELGRPAE